MQAFFRTAVAIACLTAACHGQSASFSTFGTGCAAFPSITLTATGVPALGTTMTLHYSGPNSYQVSGVLEGGNQPILLLGLSNTNAGGLPLPAMLPATVFGVPCNLLVSPDVALPMARAGSTYVSSVPLSVPMDPSLIGQVFYQQWLTFTFQRHLTGGGFVTATLRSSNGGRAAIGL